LPTFIMIRVRGRASAARSRRSTRNGTREHDARGGQVGPHHALHADRERHLPVREAALGAVDDRAVREQRREAAPAALDERGAPAHVEVGLLLAGEARFGEVLGGGAAAHRDVERLGGVGAQAVVRLDQGGLEIARQRRRQDRLAHAAPPGLQVVDVADVEPGERPVHQAIETGLGQEDPVRLGGHREAVRHQDASRRSLPVQFPEGGVLATHGPDVVDADVLEPTDQSRHDVPVPPNRPARTRPGPWCPGAKASFPTLQRERPIDFARSGS
jgi:hypothetical protein